MNFVDWLMAQRDREDSVGDLSNDVNYDGEIGGLSIVCGTYKDLLLHMKWTRDAGRDSRKALILAFREYLSSMVKVRGTQF